MAEKAIAPETRPIVLTGVVRGKKMIELDEETVLPEGCPVVLHLILQPGEGLRLAAGAWADMTPEQEAELDEMLSQLRRRPIAVPKVERHP